MGSLYNHICTDVCFVYMLKSMLDFTYVNVRVLLRFKNIQILGTFNMYEFKYSNNKFSEKINNRLFYKRFI